MGVGGRGGGAGHGELGWEYSSRRPGVWDG
jgi:hypothetical protein